MHIVTLRTVPVLVPLGGWGTNVINHADKGNMGRTVSTTASVEMVRNVTQPQENVTALQGGEGFIVTPPALWGGGGLSANNSAVVEMEGLVTM